MRGRRLPLSIPRRIVVDLMYFSQSVPTIPAHRRMKLGPVAAARAGADQRLPWPAIFAKAFGMVACERPELRRVYLKYPFPHLYEFDASVASIVVERIYANETALFALIIKDPAAQSLGHIGRTIRHAAEAPVEQIKDFQRLLSIARLPRPIRRGLWWAALASGRQRGNYFGSFAISAVSGLGTDITHARSPFPILLNYGVFDDDGMVDVRIVFDHRSLDGAVVARALQRLEEVLLGPILDEMTRA